MVFNNSAVDIKIGRCILFATKIIMGEVISMVEQELNSVIKAVKDRVVRATIQK